MLDGDFNVNTVQGTMCPNVLQFTLSGQNIGGDRVLCVDFQLFKR